MVREKESPPSRPRCLRIYESVAPAARSSRCRGGVSLFFRWKPRIHAGKADFSPPEKRLPFLFGFGSLLAPECYFAGFRKSACLPCRTHRQNRTPPLQTYRSAAGRKKCSDLRGRVSRHHEAHSTRTAQSAPPTVEYCGQRNSGESKGCSSRRVCTMPRSSVEPAAVTKTSNTLTVL